MEGISDEERERALVRDLYARAKLEGRVPCPLCCLKTDASGYLVFVDNKFYTSLGLAGHMKWCHRKIRDANIKCSTCGGYFETVPDKERHDRLLPSDH